MYSKYLVNFQQLVAFCGSQPYYDFIIDKLNQQENGFGPHFRIDKAPIIDFSDYKQDEPSTTNREPGILKYHWINKITNKVWDQQLNQSLGTISSGFHRGSNSITEMYGEGWLIAYLESDKWDERIKEFIDTVNNVKEKIQFSKKMKIRLMIMFFFGKNQSMHQGGEQALNQIKKEVDLDNKRMIVIQGDKDLVFPYLKKLKKQVIEDSNSFYEEYYHLAKPEDKKASKGEASDLRLKFELKRSLVCDMILDAKKMKKHYAEAYSIVCTLATQTQQQLSNMLVASDNDSLLTSYETIMKAEEYRYLADFVKFRQILINVNEQTPAEIFQQFDQHYRLFKNFINYKNDLLNYEEFIWRSEYFYQFIQLCQKFIREKKSFIHDAVMSLKLTNLIQSCVQFFVQREQLLQQSPNFTIALTNITVQRQKPKYLGKPNFYLKDKQQAVEFLPENKKLLFAAIIHFKKKEEKGQLGGNVQKMEECLELWEKQLKMEERVKVYIQYLKGYCHFKKKNSMDLQLVIDFIKADLLQFNMVREYTDILSMLETLLFEDQEFVDFEKLIILNFDLINFYTAYDVTPLQRFSKIKNLSDNLDEDFNCVIPSPQTTQAFTFELLLEQLQFSVEDTIAYTLSLTTFKDLGQQLTEITVVFNNGVRKTTQISDQNIHLAENFTYTNTIEIKAESLISEKNEKSEIRLREVYLDGSKDTKTNKQFLFRFLIQNPKVTVQNKNKSMPSRQVEYFELLDEDIMSKLGNCVNTSLVWMGQQGGFVEEYYEFPIKLTIKKIDPKVEISNLKVELQTGSDGGNIAQMVMPNMKLDQENVILIKRFQQETIEFILRAQENEVISKSYNFVVNFDVVKMVTKKNKDVLIKDAKSLKESFLIHYNHPFSYHLSCKGFTSIYKNKMTLSMNKYLPSKIYLPCFSKCCMVIQIQSPQPVYVHEISFQESEECLDSGIHCHHTFKLDRPVLVSPNESYQMLMIVETLDPVCIPSLGQFKILWNRRQQHSSKLCHTFLRIGELETQQHNFDVLMNIPKMAQFYHLFDMEVSIENKTAQTQNLMIQIKEAQGNELKKQFLVIGMVRKQVNLLSQQKQKVQFRLLPIEPGKCHLPGIMLEQKIVGNPSQILFDSTGQQSILVKP